MDDAEPNLKVTDRRHFTADGDLRAEAATPSEPVAPDTASPPSDAEPREAAPDPPVTLTSFVVSLATQAAGLIGGEHKDLRAARQVISALEMLQEKTEGRRTDDESKILEMVLFDLRLAFVGSVKGAAP